MADHRFDRVPEAACVVRVERAMGIEPTSLAWEAKVIAIIRRPRNRDFMRDSKMDASMRLVRRA